MLRLVSVLFAALALILSPLTMAEGSAMAMPHDAMAAMPEGPCAGTEAPATDRDPHFQADCSTACAAAPAVPPALSRNPPLLAALPALGGHQVLIGIHPERETPPPRRIPAI